MAEVKKLSLKLLVDKKKNRVVFAESDKDFIDILFSFLTLPLGTIIRLLNKNSSFGSFNRLYESVENLDTDCLQTEACKNMLLQPRSALEVVCEDLKVNVNDLKPRTYYQCPSRKCQDGVPVLYTSVAGVLCRCAKTMDVVGVAWRTSPRDKKDGVFVKGGANRFMVTDDFQAMGACTAHSLVLLKELGIRDEAILEETEVDVGQEEVLSLLGRFLMSKTPLSEVFLGQKQVTPDAVEVLKDKKIAVELETVTGENSNMIELKLFVNKDNGEVLYAEAKDDFINLLFSFLTFPLGSILKLLNGCSSLWSVDNLYNSVEVLSDCDDEYIKSESCKTMLMNPKLAHLFRCSNSMLEIDEMPLENNLLTLVNPKLPDSGTNGGGSFVKGPSRFMVTSNLVVTPVSPISVFNLMKRLKIPITNLEERIVNFGKAETLNILKSSLISDNAFNHAFSSWNWKRSLV